MAPALLSPADRAAVVAALGSRVPVCMGVARLFRFEPGSEPGSEPGPRARWVDCEASGALVYGIDKADPTVQTLSLFAPGPPARLLFEAYLYPGSHYELRYNPTAVPGFHTLELERAFVGFAFGTEVRCAAGVVRVGRSRGAWASPGICQLGLQRLAPGCRGAGVLR
ncbi:hypothetical protein T492DRAFT_895479 [Pavlovales sp. CCMP2436]|nr:hypothetical protein T492DRAFT_895479 [Pavlovales sp. CCMP2436]